MPVTKEELANYVAELGLPEDQTQSLVATLLANDKAATQFVGQRLRHSDYTKKTQELATSKQQIEQEATRQITAYAQQLSEAQGKIGSIMGDFEKERISAATANARLQTVKTKFNLGDEDIPALEGVPNPAGSGRPPEAGGGIDIDTRLKAFRQDFLKELRSDLLALPRLSAIQQDISAEHMDLTGKRLSRKDMEELLTLAEKDKLRLEDAWRQKFDIDTIRLQKRDDLNKKKWQEEWDADRKAKASDQALAGLRPGVESTSTSQSPVLGRRFNEHTDPARVSPPADKSPASPQNPPSQGGPKLSGAERAAARFMERRSQGIPLGAPEQKAS